MIFFNPTARERLPIQSEFPLAPECMLTPERSLARVDRIVGFDRLERYGRFADERGHFLRSGTSAGSNAEIPPAMDSNAIPFFQLGTLVLAATGAILGIANTWKRLVERKPKLKLVPRRIVAKGVVSDRALRAGEDVGFLFSVEIANLGASAVTVDQVGVLCGDTEARGVVMDPLAMERGEWPRRLNGHCNMKVRLNLLESPSRHIGCVFARTATGHVVRGRSDALADTCARLSKLPRHELRKARAATSRRIEEARRLRPFARRMTFEMRDDVLRPPPDFAYGLLPQDVAPSPRPHIDERRL